MTEKPVPYSVCNRCDLAQSPQHRFCARCGLELNPQGNLVELWEAKLAQDQQFKQKNISAKFPVGAMSLIGGATLIVICIVLYMVLPGIGIAVVILALPALIRTMIVVQRQKSSGKTVTEGKGLTLFLSSLVTTYLISFVTFVATAAVFLGLAIVLLFATCFSLASNQRNFDPDQVMFGIGIVSLVVGAAVFWGFSFWVRERWRRDTKI